MALLSLRYALGALLLVGAAVANVEAVTLRYQLIPASGSMDPNGSSITFVPHVGIAPPPSEPLRGEIDVTAVEPPPVGTVFLFHITRLDLHSASYQVTGSNGFVMELDLDHNAIPVSAMATVRINGEAIDLQRQDLADVVSADMPPILQGLPLVGESQRLGEYGSNYLLVIWARPMEVATVTATPTATSTFAPSPTASATPTPTGTAVPTGSPVAPSTPLPDRVMEHDGCSVGPRSRCSILPLFGFVVIAAFGRRPNPGSTRSYTSLHRVRPRK